VKALNTLDTTGANRQVVLVAEDEAIIGFELAESLRLEGFEVAGPFDTCGSAEAWLRSADYIQGAILDNSLRDGPCTALARDLRSRGIPFVVYSGHSRGQETLSEFDDAPWVVKPVLFEVLLRALQTAIA
jgi:DNA-binding response OmpR family regulator